MTAEHNPYQLTPAETAIQATLLTLVGAIGLLLNGTLVAVILRSGLIKRGLTFAFGLSLMHFVLSLLAIPFIVTGFLLQSWPLGVPSCKAIGFLTDSLLNVALLIECAVAYDRLLLLTHPLKNRGQTRVCKLAALCIVYVVLLMTSSLFQEGVIAFAFEQFRCMVTYERAPYKLYYVIVGQLLPILVTVAIYGKIYRQNEENRERKVAQLKASDSKLGGGSSSPLVKPVLLTEARTKQNVLVSVTVFLLIWLPRSVVDLVTAAGAKRGHFSVPQVVHFLALWLSLASCVSSAVIYGLMNIQIRKAAKKCCPNSFCKVALSCCRCWQLPSPKKPSEMSRQRTMMTNHRKEPLKLAIVPRPDSKMPGDLRHSRAFSSCPNLFLADSDATPATTTTTTATSTITVIQLRTDKTEESSSSGFQSAQENLDKLSFKSDEKTCNHCHRAIKDKQENPKKPSAKKSSSHHHHHHHHHHPQQSHQHRHKGHHQTTTADWTSTCKKSADSSPASASEPFYSNTGFHADSDSESSAIL